MSSVTKKFVLVGPHAGKSMAVNGHQFEDGECVVHGSEQQMAVLTNIFSFYGAVPEERAELDRLRAQVLQQQATTPAQTDAPAQTDTPVGSTTNEPKASEAEVKPTLAEAIGMLDPDTDSHWTSNNLPGLDDLERLTGKKVSRQEVEAIAPGYTRAKARQAKSML